MTSELVPLNCNAPPYLPAVDHVVFPTVPLFPFPDASVDRRPGPLVGWVIHVHVAGSGHVDLTSGGCISSSSEEL